MKSAYELAMERLEKQAPSVKLTEEQKAQIAELDSLYASRIAERELSLNEQIRAAVAAGDQTKADALREELVRELKRLREELESRKEKVRLGGQNAEL